MFQVRRMGLCDVDSCVQIHLAAFPGFFLTFLGSSFLKEFYTGVIRDPGGFGLVAEEGSRLIGFVVGTAQPQGFFKRLLQHRWWRFGLAALGPLLRRPLIAARLLRAFQKPSEDLPVAKCGTLMSIAVAPGTQHGGVGQALLNSFVEECCRCADIEYVNLTTDADHNERANCFYQKAGFQLVRSYVTPEGRAMNEYLIPLHSTHQPVSQDVETGALELDPVNQVG